MWLRRRASSNNTWIRSETFPRLLSTGRLLETGAITLALVTNAESYGPDQAPQRIVKCFTAIQFVEHQDSPWTC
jgi:hypothetical protein